ncbi:MAG: hypothetical protein IPN65_04925 [Elusimicrobia bacterium]|jgi:cation:H+ antiporter|nr:hypothetical protein [Elusimicrobiota bacterium]MBK7544175.1 hypothetical protein [Elusimicrobiota bacterium]MBK7573697.1 hypothetical protein [Elusimicrobiota bacterium]MBK8125840.1 hypothetical protein [Elusimicrobiota bacterium]MBK8422859.1 hypothetical protein [Elusimicrobiota bacterium]
MQETIFSAWGGFALAAAFVVAAGTLIGRLSGELGERFGLGRAWSGAVLLSFATTLPELVTTFTAVQRNALGLALGGVTGTITFNLFILVLVDLIEPEGTPIYPRLSQQHLATGLLGCLLLGVLVLGLSLGLAFPAGSLGVGHGLARAAPLFLLVFYFLGQRVLFTLARGTPREETPLRLRTVFDRAPTGALIGIYVVVAGVILAAGRSLVGSAEALADLHRWGDTFAGALLLGVVTSLPEISNAVACARQKEFDLALGNVLGANAMVLVVLAVVALVRPGGPLLAAVPGRDGLAAVALAGIGIVMQGTLLGALAIHSAHRVWRVGLASILLAFMYLLSLVITREFGVFG